MVLQSQNMSLTLDKMTLDLEGAANDTVDDDDDTDPLRPSLDDVGGNGTSGPPHHSFALYNTSNVIEQAKALLRTGTVDEGVYVRRVIGDRTLNEARLSDTWVAQHGMLGFVDVAAGAVVHELTASESQWNSGKDELGSSDDGQTDRWAHESISHRTWGADPGLHLRRAVPSGHQGDGKIEVRAIEATLRERDTEIKDIFPSEEGLVRMREEWETVRDSDVYKQRVKIAMLRKAWAVHCSLVQVDVQTMKVMRKASSKTPPLCQDILDVVKSNYKNELKPVSAGTSTRLQFTRSGPGVVGKRTRTHVLASSVHTEVDHTDGVDTPSFDGAIDSERGATISSFLGRMGKFISGYAAQILAPPRHGVRADTGSDVTVRVSIIRAGDCSVVRKHRESTPESDGTSESGDVSESVDSSESEDPSESEVKSALDGILQDTNDCMGVTSFDYARFRREWRSIMPAWMDTFFDIRVMSASSSDPIWKGIMGGLFLAPDEDALVLGHRAPWRLDSKRVFASLSQLSRSGGDAGKDGDRRIRLQDKDKGRSVDVVILSFGDSVPGGVLIDGNVQAAVVGEGVVLGVQSNVSQLGSKFRSWPASSGSDDTSTSSDADKKSRRKRNLRDPTGAVLQATIEAASGLLAVGREQVASSMKGGGMGVQTAFSRESVLFESGSFPSSALFWGAFAPGFSDTSAAVSFRHSIASLYSKAAQRVDDAFEILSHIRGGLGSEESASLLQACAGRWLVYEQVRKRLVDLCIGQACEDPAGDGMVAWQQAMRLVELAEAVFFYASDIARISRVDVCESHHNGNLPDVAGTAGTLLRDLQAEGTSVDNQKSDTNRFMETLSIAFKWVIIIESTLLLVAMVANRARRGWSRR